ncbi:MAG: DUF354 domain-containing protein [Actinomycetia bacterium]|nr:DUF354 domain-containing protein [Actinomycetes bacterium]
MRVLFDVVHPAHVHFYRNLIGELGAAGDDLVVVSRHKDVTVELLDRLEIEHVPIGTPGGAGRVGQASELMTRDAKLARLVRSFRPDLVCTRNPSGVHAALARRSTISIFDTDDGAAAGLHYRLASIADVITMPDALTPTRPARTHQYPSYKALAYLHPDRFTPDPGIRVELGVGDEPLFIIRLVAMAASHDHGESGLDAVTRRGLVEMLASRGRLFISSESVLPAELEQYQIPLGPDRLHDLLATADLYVGDSQTVATEAALLGTPTLHVSSWSRRLDLLVELEDRFGLLRSFTPDDTQILAVADGLSADPSQVRLQWKEGRDRMLAERIDLTSWYLDLMRALV